VRRSGLGIVPWCLLAAGLVTRDVRADDLSTKKACVDMHERAQQLRQAGHLVAARDQLTACSEATCPGLIRSDCAQWLLEVDDIMPTIVLGARDAGGADLADVKVTCDGREIATHLDGRVVPVDPGEHVFHFEYGGSPPVESHVVMREGERVRAVVAQFQAPFQAPVSARRPVSAYVVGGLAIGTLGSFAFFGIRGLMSESDLSSSCSPHCTDDQVRGARTDLLVADISLGATAVLGGAAAWLFFSNRKADAAPAAAPLAFSVSRDLAGRHDVRIAWSAQFR
jgi:hypothetical protein